MIGNVFIDSNIWIYYYSMAPDDKFTRAKTLILDNFASLVLGTQILGELYNVLIRKNMASEADAKLVITDLVSEFPVIAMDSNDMNMRYGYSYWDSLIIATAIQSDCTILYSEDMQHDQFIENKLTIVNPFL